MRRMSITEGRAARTEPSALSTDTRIVNQRKESIAAHRDGIVGAFGINPADWDAKADLLTGCPSGLLTRLGKRTSPAAIGRQ